MKLCIRVALIMVSVYWIRQIIKRIPSPFNKLYGYDSKRVSEIQGGAIVAFSILALNLIFSMKFIILFIKFLNSL